MTRPAFTLIESLAVVALLALAVSTLAVGIAPSAGSARLREARSAVLDADARARVLAQRGNIMLLALDEHAVWARDATDPRAEPLVYRSLPAGVSVCVRGTTDGQPWAALRIGADGRSEDYVLTVAAGGRSSETVVAGLTGYAFEPRVAEKGGTP